jgi:catechol 2,3-dioxygenase-like lactoylglutathione lyase family enzyme
MPQLTAIDHFVLTVADTEATAAFYQALGMRLERFAVAGEPDRLALHFGPHKINLHRAGHPFQPHARVPEPGTGDFCLLTDAPIADWVVHLEKAGIGIIEGPVGRTGARGPLESIYLRDPDGNLVEIARYAERRT